MKIKISTISMYFSIMVMLMRSSITIREVKYLNEFLVICQVLIFLNYGIKIFTRSKKISIFTKLMIIMYIMLFISTCIGTKDFKRYISSIVDRLGAIFIVEYYIYNDYKELLKILRNCLSILLIGNTITVLIFSNGLPVSILSGDKCFLLGPRYHFSHFVMPFIMVSLLNDKIKYNKFFSTYTILIIIICMISLIEQKVVTGIFGVLIAIALIVLYLKGKINFLTLGKFIIVYSVIFIAIVVFSIQYKSSLLKYILVDVMHKDLAFNYRTHIWNATMEEIREKPILGHGVAHGGTVFVENVGKIGPHNQILHIVHAGGIISLIICIIIFIIINKNIEKNKIHYVSQVNKSVMIASLIMMITTIPSEKCLIFFSMALAYFSPILVDNNKEEIEITTIKNSI